MRYGLRYIANVCLLLVGSSATVVHSQDWEPSTTAELKRSIALNTRLYEERKHMRLVTHVDAYSGAQDRAPHERSTSTLWRMGDQYKMEYMDVVSYQDKELLVTIDKDSRSILVGVPTDPMDVVRGGLQDSVLVRVAKVGKRVMANGTHYRLMFGGVLGYDVVDVVFDQTGWMRRMELHWAQEVDLRYRDTSSPRVRPKVVFELGVPERIAAGEVDADPRKVVELHADGPVAKGPWKGYEVFDTRIR